VRYSLRRLAPVAALATGACFATRSDVQILQNDLQIMRAETAQRDSARAIQLDRLAAALQALDIVQDSLRLLSVRTLKFQGDVSGSIYSIEQQLLQIQELTGQSQRRLQELRAEMEVQNQQIMAPPVVPPATTAAPPDTSKPAAGAPATTAGGTTVATASGPPPGTPGPNQLFQLALDQLRRGSTGTARSGFQDLLRQYPTADVADDAQFFIAESYAQEGKTLSADSAYVAVVQKYPTSERAPTALYKHALALISVGQTEAARATLDDVVKRYPRSDEAVLARDRLRTLK
jgi:tol-pal system protein YbgF